MVFKAQVERLTLPSSLTGGKVRLWDVLEKEVITCEKSVLRGEGIRYTTTADVRVIQSPGTMKIKRVERRIQLELFCCAAVQQDSQAEGLEKAIMEHPAGRSRSRHDSASSLRAAEHMAQGTAWGCCQ